MKKIRINFCDFWPNFNYIESDFYKILSQKYQVEISDNPEFLFYSVFGNNHLEYECIKIFYTGENVIPDFNLCDYGIGYAHLNFDDRYLRFPIFRIYGYEKFLKIALNIHKETIKKRKKFCNFIYSNNKADKEKEEFYKLLSQYKKIDSGGRYLNNIGEPVKDKFLFQQQYKFSIAFENTSSKGYTTEKLIEAKAAGTIPIYWGNPEIAKEFNTKSFINCHEYENFDEVIEVIKKIDNDDELYLKYLNEPFSLEGFDLEKKELSDFLYNIIEKKQILRSIDKTSKGFSNYSKLVYLKKIEKIKILKKIIKIFVK
ncbi:hypothetical protein I6E36_00025 [Fusobacterium mortiferum]|uniref:glycosyltransferase family 10 domain-containing protein n=1 Tax=Fusobacterium mortiferum TaxID=850 RepID=UPI001F3E6133|nr:glycosyltransferase family 10 [Fusobacterium mortiferum]MCF2626455.1 hypothetical protein [Fusobacterium mortiferum]